MGSSTPLLNDYKQEFFWKRFPQTVLGGPKLKLGFCAPYYVYLGQILVFFLPFLYGGIFTLLVEFSIIGFYTAVFVSGGLMTLSVLCIQTTGRVILWRKSSSISPERLHSKRNILSDEDDLEFDSCCDVKTLQFVIPSKKYILNIVCHAFLSAPLVGISTWYLLPSTLSSFFSNIGGNVVLFIFGWVTVCIAQYSLTIGAPPEIAIYRATDTYELYAVTRPFYVIICLSIHVINYYMSSLQQLNEVLHIIFVFLPVLWTLGLLPPVDALFLWLLEQSHIFLLGGSAMASDIRLFLVSTLSVICFLIVYFISSAYVLMALMASFGYLLSIDLGGLINQIVHMCKKSQSSLSEHSNTGFLWHWTWKESIFHICVTVIVGGLAVGISYIYATYGSSTTTVNNYVGFAIMGLLVLEVVLADIQKVYMFFGLIRNCVYPTSVMKSDIFRARKKKLNGLGLFRRLLVSFVCPLVMLTYITLSFRITSGNSSVVPALNTLGTLRAFRWIWQNTTCSMLEISVLTILSVIFRGDSTWANLGLGVQLIILSFVRNRLALVFDKLYFWFTLTVMFWIDRKQRRKSSPGLVACNFILFPLMFAIICFAAFLAAPLLPLFTLPVFFIGYPRPLRFWPATPGMSQNTCADSVYYQQVAPQIAQAFHDGFVSGSIGDASPGQHYLVRFQDRLMWVQVLERGFGFCTLSIKGMELQETSCHTVEATRVDDIIEETFENSEPKCCMKNKYFLHTACPCDVKIIKTYSDAKNQLTGVIDSPQTISTIKSCFTQMLTWVLLKAMKKSNTNISSSELTKESHIQNKSLLPMSNKVDKSPPVASNHETSQRLSRPQSRGADSVNSFVNSMWSDDEDSLLGESCDKKNKANLTLNAIDSNMFSSSPAKLPPVNQTSLPPPIKSLPPLLATQDDVDNLFKDLDLGLPVKDVMDVNRASGPPSLANPQKCNFSSAHSSRLSFPARWLNIPLDEGQLSRHGTNFSVEWFKYVLMQLQFESARENDPQLVAKEISEDKSLIDMYRKVIGACHAVIYDLGLSGSESSSSHVYKVYRGDIPWSIASEWVTEDKEFLSLVLKAFRYAVKFSIDQMLLGEATSHAEIQEYLEEYDTQWYIGTEKDKEWNESIITGKPQLFSLAYVVDKGIYTSRVLTVQESPIYICSLNPEAVHAQWANLNLELLYMTNDDEERYSIQAHQTLLRNLNVQAADPPLGYPIYASDPVSVPCL